jgi:serine/threonine-protein phosphatase 6 catalytic subunit
MSRTSLVSSDDIESWISTLRSGECLSERSLRRLCQSASELLMEESNVQPVLSPVTIVGDLHGQFYDLLQLLSPEVGGEPPSSSFVFLGDFVDRGHNSVETLSLLLCLKMKYPGHVTLLRGNHEVSNYVQFLHQCCSIFPS